METKSWTVVYRNKWTSQTVTAAVFAPTLEAATRQARADAEVNGCKNWRIESVKPSTFVFPTSEELTILEEFAKTQKPGGSRMCPRCGRHDMDEDPARNALSRAAKIQICDACGTDEAIRAMSGNELPIREWAIVAAKNKPGYECSGWRCPSCGAVVTLTDKDEAPDYCYKCPACGAVTGADEWEEVQA